VRRRAFHRHINPNDFAFRPDDLRGDETDFARAAAQIENGFTFTHITEDRATIIALDHF